MRLWHKDLISVLPRQQLLGQWQECCCIARNMAVNGTPNHLLVNKIMDYPIEHFSYYGCLVGAEMAKRGYNNHLDNFLKWQKKEDGTNPFPYPDYDDLFKGWHDNRYLLQCYYNLQEKFDCGGIPEDEWHAVDVLVKAKETKYFIEHAIKDPLGYALKSNDPAAVYNRRFIIESEWRKDNG